MNDEPGRHEVEIGGPRLVILFSRVHVVSMPVQPVHAPVRLRAARVERREQPRRRAQTPTQKRARLHSWARHKRALITYLGMCRMGTVAMVEGEFGESTSLGYLHENVLHEDSR